jgi:starch-binding outer membrane protein, SusD/RagB family
MRILSTRSAIGQAARRGALALALLGTIVWTAGCDLQVDNPGAIEDADLDTPGAINAVVNGAMGQFGYATTIPGGGGIYLSGAILTDELVHVGSWQPVIALNEGRSINTEPENQSRWGFASRARWTAEDAIRRLDRVLDNPAANARYLDATLYAGFSNRMMGDTFCDAVIDGGPMEPYTAFHDRAIGHLNNAITLAQQQNRGHELNAAYGARAQARIMIGDWSGAVSDAGQVPTEFEYVQVHSDNAAVENNGIYNWAGRGDNGNQVSVWGTPFAEWGLEVNDNYEAEGDPRVRYEVQFEDDGDVETGGDNRRPLWFSRKYASAASSIPIVKGTEMRFIEAEAFLLDGQWQQAIDKVNEVRAYRGLADVSAGSAQEARELFMKEKGIEHWLEGRRLPDIRRWSQDNGWDVPFNVVRAPASGQPATADQRVSVLAVERMCLEVSSNEIESNPNL